MVSLCIWVPLVWFPAYASDLLAYGKYILTFPLSLASSFCHREFLMARFPWSKSAQHCNLSCLSVLLQLHPQQSGRMGVYMTHACVQGFRLFLQWIPLLCSLLPCFCWRQFQVVSYQVSGTFLSLLFGVCKTMKRTGALVMLDDCGFKKFLGYMAYCTSHGLSWLLCMSSWLRYAFSIGEVSDVLSCRSLLTWCRNANVERIGHRILPPSDILSRRGDLTALRTNQMHLQRWFLRGTPVYVPKFEGVVGGSWRWKFWSECGWCRRIKATGILCFRLAVWTWFIKPVFVLIMTNFERHARLPVPPFTYLSPILSIWLPIMSLGYMTILLLTLKWASLRKHWRPGTRIFVL